MTIPYRERGYSIELDTLIVHERYQDHAPEARRTSAVGINNVRMQRGGVLVECETCFPPPPKSKGKGVTKASAPIIVPTEAIEDGMPVPAAAAFYDEVLQPDWRDDPSVTFDAPSTADASVTVEPAPESETE